ncbi:MAG: hypothetical protein KKB20_18830, partial [Proteobacteria bacterium]|nr:hypothetical protein [Pseudomonadota bacterium]
MARSDDLIPAVKWTPGMKLWGDDEEQPERQPWAGILTGEPAAKAPSLSEQLSRLHAADLQRAAARHQEEMGDARLGWHRGVHGMKSSYYGAKGLVWSLAGADDWRDEAFRDYLRESDEAKKYAPRVESFGKALEGPGEFVDWAQGTFGELAPSMIEAFITSIIGAGIGAVAGSAATPGPGTAAGGVTGALAGFMGKQGVKAFIKQAARKYAAKGLVKDAAEKAALEELEQVGRKAVVKSFLTNIGGKAGIVAGVAPIEAGGNWGELMERGIDAPWSALATGTAAGFLELAGGNVRLLDRFLPNKSGLIRKAIQAGDARLVGRMVKEAARQGGEEFMQEAGQELLSMANVAVNDPTFEKWTRKNLDRLIESGMAGALAGTAGGTVSGAWDKFQKPAGGGADNQGLPNAGDLVKDAGKNLSPMTPPKDIRGMPAPGTEASSTGPAGPEITSTGPAGPPPQSDPIPSSGGLVKDAAQETVREEQLEKTAAHRDLAEVVEELKRQEGLTQARLEQEAAARSEQEQTAEGLSLEPAYALEMKWDKTPMDDDSMWGDMTAHVE